MATTLINQVIRFIGHILMWQETEGRDILIHNFRMNVVYNFGSWSKHEELGNLTAQSYAQFSCVMLF